MTTVSLKKNLHKIIDHLDDPMILNAIYALLLKMDATEADGWDTLSEKQKEEIEAALSELDSGKGISHHKVLAKYKGKYT